MSDEQVMGVATSRSLEHVASVLAEQGMAFACRYYNFNSASKNLSRSEASALEAAGLQIVSVWENGYPTQRGYFTQKRGAWDGQRAMELAASLDQPDQSPVFFAVDYDACYPVDREAVEAYFRGIDEGATQAWEAMGAAGNADPPIYTVGVYGGRCVLEWLEAAGLASYFWQAGAPAWSLGKNRELSPLAHLHSRPGTHLVKEVLVNHIEACQEDYGGWTRVIG